VDRAWLSGAVTVCSRIWGPTEEGARDADKRGRSNPSSLPGPKRRAGDPHGVAARGSICSDGEPFAKAPQPRPLDFVKTQIQLTTVGVKGWGPPTPLAGSGLRSRKPTIETSCVTEGTPDVCFALAGMGAMRSERSDLRWPHARKRAAAARCELCIRA
jgi:hypothetical protein